MFHKTSTQISLFNAVLAVFFSIYASTVFSVEIDNPEDLTASEIIERIESVYENSTSYSDTGFVVPLWRKSFSRKWSK